MKNKGKGFKCKCCGQCCELIAFEISLFQELKHKAQKPYELKKQFYNKLDQFIKLPKKHMKDHIYPVTEDWLCVFNTPDLTCAIYERRPDICRLFGNVPFLPCKQTAHSRSLHK